MYQVFKIQYAFILIAHHNLDTKDFSEIVDLHLDLIKFIVEKVDSHTQVILSLKVLQ